MYTEEIIFQTSFFPVLWSDLFGKACGQKSGIPSKEGNNIKSYTIVNWTPWTTHLLTSNSYVHITIHERNILVESVNTYTWIFGNQICRYIFWAINYRVVYSRVREIMQVYQHTIMYIVTQNIMLSRTLQAKKGMMSNWPQQ